MAVSKKNLLARRLQTIITKRLWFPHSVYDPEEPTVEPARLTRWRWAVAHIPGAHWRAHHRMENLSNPINVLVI